MSQQGLRQASVRAVTGTALTYEGDWHALFDKAGIAAGDFDGRLLRWINGRLSASHTELNGAMQAFAASQGAPGWSAMGTFSAAAGFTKVAAGLPLLAIGDSQINYGNGSGFINQIAHAMMGITSQAHAHDPRWNNDNWSVGAQFTASISGNTMTVTALAADAPAGRGIRVGDIVAGGSTRVNTKVTAQVSGTPGGVGDYTVNGATQTVASGTKTASPNGIFAEGMNRGVAGQTTAEIIARIPDELAKACPVWLLEGGINNAGLGLVVSNLTSGVDTLLADASVKAIIVMTLPPWGTGYVNNADRQTNYGAVNQGIKAMVAAKQAANPTRKIVLLDAAVLCGINPATYAWQAVASTAPPGTDSYVYRNDGLHWSTYMAYVLSENPLGTSAKGLREILSEIYEAGDFYETLAASGTHLLSSNGSRFIGATQTPSGRFSGTIPASLTAAGGVSVSIACSVVDNAETGGKSAVFTVTPGGTADEIVTLTLGAAANVAGCTGTCSGDILTANNSFTRGPYKEVQVGDVVTGTGITASSVVLGDPSTGILPYPGTTGIGGPGTYKLSQSSTASLTNLAFTTPITAGDWYRFLVEIEFDSWAYWGGCSIQLDQLGDVIATTSTAGNYRVEVGDSLLTSCKYPAAERQKFATPPMQLTGSPTQIIPAQFKLIVRNNGATGTGVFKIHRMRVFKTASPTPAFGM